MSSSPLFRACAWLLRRMAPDAADAVLGDLLEEWHHSGSRVRFLLHAGSVIVRYAPSRLSRPRVAARERNQGTWTACYST